VIKSRRINFRKQEILIKSGYKVLENNQPDTDVRELKTVSYTNWLPTCEIKCTADTKICPLVYKTLQTFPSRIIYLIKAYFQNITTFFVLRATAFQKIPSAFCRDNCHSNQMFRTVTDILGIPGTETVCCSVSE